MRAPEDSRGTGWLKSRALLLYAVTFSQDIPSGFKIDRYAQVWEDNPFTLMKPAAPNENNLHLVEVHPNPNPQLVEVVVSDGKEQGTVQFRFDASAGVAFDGLLVSKPCAFRIKTGCPPCLPLAEQIPASIQHDLNLPEPVAVGIRGGAVRFPLVKFVLLARKLIDVVSGLLIVHEAP
jgi:hypothetical protein